MSRCLANCQSVKQGAVNHSLFGLAICLDHSVRLKQSMESPALALSVSCGLGLASLQSRHHYCKFGICLSIEIVYKGLVFLSVFLFQSSFSLITIVSSPVNSIKYYEHFPNHTNSTRAAPPLQKPSKPHTKCLDAHTPPPPSPMDQGPHRPPSARADQLATTTTEDRKSVV